ncbi:MAG: hypothetical protein ACLTS6_15350 [Anaerobutyricum sp.]
MRKKSKKNIPGEIYEKDAAKDIKIAFFDVDGTLVDMEKKIISLR